MKRKFTDEQLIDAVKTSLSKAEVMRKLNLHVGGANYDTIKRCIKQLGLDISHFTGAAWNQGSRYTPVQPPKPLEQILVENSSWTSSYHLRNRLLKEGYKEYKCECCGRTKWLDRPIALELHHINGIKDDLRLENLQILCPNCHAFTDNYRGKNR